MSKSLISTKMRTGEREGGKGQREREIGREKEREREGGGRVEIILREENFGQIKYNVLLHQE